VILEQLVRSPKKIAEEGRTLWKVGTAILSMSPKTARGATAEKQGNRCKKHLEKRISRKGGERILQDIEAKRNISNTLRTTCHGKRGGDCICKEIG